MTLLTGVYLHPFSSWETADRVTQALVVSGVLFRQTDKQFQLALPERS